MTNNQSTSNNTVPDSMTQVGIITKYTFLDYLRSRRFFVLFIITILIGVILTVLVHYRSAAFTTSNLDFYSSYWGSAVTFVIILSGIFFGGDAVSGEFQNKTGYFTIPNPIRRSSIYVGKWLAAFIASTVMFATFAIFSVGTGAYFFGSNIPYQFGESLLFALLYLAAVLSFTFFFSSLFKSSVISVIVTVILFFFVFNLLDSFILPLAGIEPWFIITYGAGIIGNVLTSPFPAHGPTTAPLGPRRLITLTTFNATIPEGIAILVLYLVITAILGLIIFERKEFT
jgi:ABC-2 type transport system permease protein